MTSEPARVTAEDVEGYFRNWLHEVDCHALHNTVWTHPSLRALCERCTCGRDVAYEAMQRLAAQAQRDAEGIKKWRDEADEYHQLLCVEIERVKAGEQEIARLRAELEHRPKPMSEDELRLVGVEFVPRSALAAAEQRVRALETALQRLAGALDDAEGNRGVYSCASRHDLRCPKSRAASPAEWRGTWECECGSEELIAAQDAARAALATPEGT